VTSTDIGAQIEVRVTATNATGTSTAVTSPPTAATSLPIVIPATAPTPSLTAPVGPIIAPQALTLGSEPPKTPVSHIARLRLTVAVLARLRSMLLHQARLDGDRSPSRARAVATTSHLAEGLLTAGSHDRDASTPAYLVCASGTFGRVGMSPPPGAHPRHAATRTLCLVVLGQGWRVTELSVGERYPDLAKLGAVKSLALAPAR
jgi:hypothetical protein